ncbi:polyketide synthase-like protein [Xylariaceae sp. FL0804]|nr:polyketide synthase-like protein [Xylariaceae sp. FL0804]
MGNLEPIAIVGSGCRFPGNANAPSTLYEVLCNPREFLVPIPEERFNSRGFYHKKGQYHGHTNVGESYLLSGEGSHRRFDAHFFGISPAEANVMDPQVRLLLETVYEALDNAGQTIQDLRGLNTAVYAGLMTSDYEHIMGRDEDAMGTYHVTGTSRALMSNRISYFFDWHGPSMTIDTACSSSLYAVHYSVQQLRSGASRVAVAAGSNLLLDPVGAESKLQILSPSSRSRMWDASADGYSAAESDGDHIECVIRETAVNQDGRTKGITVPNAEAQANLIRDCYDRAGLDVCSPAGRPQYFETHGTGTLTGDPIEAEAIDRAFFNHSVKNAGSAELLVGSIKTVLGHTEATAGLAGVLKASLALQHAVVPPNLLFNRLNPQIEPFYSNLLVPTSATPWPCALESSARRASVNSFGFGGANAHAILESYSAPPRQASSSNGPVFCPFIFSAASEASLRGYLSAFVAYLQVHGVNQNMRDLAYTLHSRRTRFPYVASFPASTAKQLALKIEQYIARLTLHADELLVPIARTSSDTRKPRILAVFTGQGAQWARMGARLISESAHAQRVLDKLQARLARLPVNDRPTSSRVAEAELSQPLSTAVGILLVDILRQARVDLTAAVGHSSGEIAAAYAAGLISADDAICIAYYRGFHAKEARGPEAPAGSMMAVGTSVEAIKDLLHEPEFQGRAYIAAVNSATSVTLSGDANAIKEISVVLKDENKFFRLLEVDMAYYSSHMVPCLKPYLSSLRETKIQNDVADLMGSLDGPYWDTIERAYRGAGPFDLTIELGPHPALKQPVTQIIHDLTGHTIPYTEALANGLGYVAKHTIKGFVDFQYYDAFMSGSASAEEYWHESRYTRAVRRRLDDVHELLGHLTPDSTDRDKRRRHLLRQEEIPWLKGHQLQNQMVFPAAGYVVAASEASKALLDGAPASVVEVANLDINQALTFDNPDSSIETDKNKITATFTHNAATGKRGDALNILASALPARKTRLPSLIRLEKHGVATGFISDIGGSELIVPVALLDAALWLMHVPRRIKSVMSKGKRLPFDAFYPIGTSTIAGSVDIFPEVLCHAIIQIEGLEYDKVLFSRTVWGEAFPNTMDIYDLAYTLQRMAFPLDHSSRRKGPYTGFFKFASHTLSRAKRRGRPFWEPEWEHDDSEIISTVSSAYRDMVDIRLLRAIAIDIGMKDNLLARYYQDGLGMHEYAQYLARTVKQLVFQHPRLRYLEVGAGTGGATKVVLEECGRTFSSYTFTDISTKCLTDNIRFKVLDITKDSCLQGFEKHSYDLIIASMVLHTTTSLLQTLRNARSLLRPEGYLTVLKVESDAPARTGTVFGAFPGWWVGSTEGRELTPCISLTEWDNLLRKSGFSGCDTVIADPDPLVYGLAVFSSQAVDDRVNFIRNPLSITPVPADLHLIQDLVILGGSSLKVSSKTTVLSLTELDRPVFRDLNELTWDVITRLLQETSTILWVTQGRRYADPYANMMTGLLRSSIHETPGLEVQLLDIEDPENLTSRSIGEAVLRFQAMVAWKNHDAHEFEENAFGIIERELVIEKSGRLLNLRYNSSRRLISTMTDTSEHVCGPEKFTDSRNTMLIVGGGQLFLALSTKNTSAISQDTILIIPVEVAPGGEAPFLYLTADDGDRIMVHEPSPVLVIMLRGKAQARAISVVFTTIHHNGPPGCIPIHPNGPRRALKSLELDSVTVFLDFATTYESRNIAGRIRSQLPHTCKCESVRTKLAGVGRAPSPAEIIAQAGVELLKLPKLDQQCKVILPTYWLAGLSGSLGLSLCQWMVRYGARFVVISRMAALGVVVKIRAWYRLLDVTKKDDVAALHAEICSTLPPIGGVAQGAMVLQDTAISEMSLETFQKVTKPKVDGSVHLSNQFQQDSLEFFVFFSSVSVVIGTPGQSSYVAANMFMASLAEQRRQKNLAASVINIGPIIGAGYLAQQQTSIPTVKKPFSYMHISDQDFHHLFAEGIIAGRPHSTSSVSITSGVKRVRMDDETQPIWALNPLITHYILNGDRLEDTPTDAGRKKSLRVQLLGAESHEVVRRLIKDALLAKLGVLLQLEADTVSYARLEATRLDELGLDSLMATEVRAWLLKNL